MKHFATLLFSSILVSALICNAALAQVSTKSSNSNNCQQALATQNKPFSELDSCTALIALGNGGDNSAYTQLGTLLLTQSDTSVHKRGLYYLSLAADSGNQTALEQIYQYLSARMVTGKVPVKLAYLADYLAKHWQQQGQPPAHPFAEYQHWLSLVEQSYDDPQALTAEQIEALAIDFENGYFLGKNEQQAHKLYQLAANKGRSYAQYKHAQLIYPQSQQQALILLKQAAQDQSADAMMMLGDHFGCLGQKASALNWYQQAADAGHEYAQDEIATLNETGKPSQCD